MPPRESESEYDRGHRQGEISAELREHALHLEKINGSMDRVADRLGEVSTQLSVLLQAIARIDQAMTADKETVRQTAAALRDQADVAGRRNETRWTPFNRTLATVTAIGGLIATTYLLIHGGP